MQTSTKPTTGRTAVVRWALLAAVLVVALVVLAVAVVAAMVTGRPLVGFGIVAIGGCGLWLLERYVALKAAGREVLADAADVAGMRDQLPFLADPAKDAFELLDQIAALEAKGDLTEEAAARLAAYKVELSERAVASIDADVAKHGIQRQADAREAEEAAAEAIAEEGDAAERAALARIAEGDLEGGLKALTAEAEAATDDAVARWRRLGALAYDVDTARALAAYGRAVVLGSTDPWDAIFLGRLHGRAGAVDEALAVFETAQAGLRANDERNRGVLAHEVGTIQFAKGNFEAALQSFEKYHTIAERLSLSDPKNAEWQRDRLVSLNRIGDVRRAQRNSAGALQAYQAGLAIAERLASLDPSNAEWQRDLSVSWNKVGDMRVVQRDVAGALEAYQAALAIVERLAASDPVNAVRQRDLALSLERLGDMRGAQDDFEGALQIHGASLAIRERLAAMDPNNAEWQRDFIVSNVKMAERTGDGTAAKSHLEAALAVADALADAGRLAPADAWMPADLRRRLAGLEGD
ncbi:MAG: hypothetical protein AAFX81_05635 [Pseudomonadota bacterium]